MRKDIMRVAVMEYLSSMGKYGNWEWQLQVRAVHVYNSVYWTLKQVLKENDLSDDGFIPEMAMRVTSSIPNCDAHELTNMAIIFNEKCNSILTHKDIKHRISVAGRFILGVLTNSFSEKDEEVQEWIYWVERCMEEEGEA